MFARFGLFVSVVRADTQVCPYNLVAIDTRVCPAIVYHILRKVRIGIRQPVSLARRPEVCETESMRCKLFFITCIMGLGAISGILKGLSTPRGEAKKEEGEKAGGKEEQQAETAGP